MLLKPRASACPGAARPPHPHPGRSRPRPVAHDLAALELGRSCAISHDLAALELDDALDEGERRGAVRDEQHRLAGECPVESVEQCRLGEEVSRKSPGIVEEVSTKCLGSVERVQQRRLGVRRCEKV